MLLAEEFILASTGTGSCIFYDYELRKRNSVDGWSFVSASVYDGCVFLTDKLNRVYFAEMESLWRLLKSGRPDPAADVFRKFLPTDFYRCKIVGYKPKNCLLIPGYSPLCCLSGGQNQVRQL